MKKIIFRKLAQDCTKFFLLTIFTISMIIWVLQAVNYLDFVIEDGHGFLVYFNYTLLSFPKILSRIFPFSVFLAFAYILLKYETKNELIIFWNFGISKIKFINFFIKFSFMFVLLSLLLNTLIVPLTQDKARSFIRSSDLDFFENMLKPKQFIDIVKNLTIYYEKKTKDGNLKNIFLNDKLGENEFQITFAKTGKFQVNNKKKVLILYDGKTINNKNENFSEFEFSQTNFNIAKFNTKSITQRKTQENSTLELIQCLLILKNAQKNQDSSKAIKMFNCSLNNLENIYEELYSRLIKPFYIIFLVAISLLFILKSKIDHTFNSYKFKIYLFGFLFTIFLETSSKFISINFLQNLFISFLPFIFVFLIYLYFLNAIRKNT